MLLWVHPLRAQSLDVILAGGTVIDGTGAAGYRADIGLKGKRIMMVSRKPIRDIKAKTIDISGLVISPGFIDMHAHINPITKLPEARSMVSQGVTTAIGGPDGSAPWPLAPYLTQLERQGIGLNVCLLVGHNSVRRGVMALANRAPTDKELARMRQMVAQAMDEGGGGRLHLFVIMTIFFLTWTFFFVFSSPKNP